MLALTDHDEVGGLAEARDAALDAGITLICGSELSVTWEGITIHVVALGIDPTQRDADRRPRRDSRRAFDRARGASADALAGAGIHGAYEGAMRYVTSERLVSRTHFARYLVEAGHAREMKDVFARYLTPGKPGYVAHDGRRCRRRSAGSMRRAGRRSSRTPAATR